MGSEIPRLSNVAAPVSSSSSAILPPRSRTLSCLAKTPPVRVTVVRYWNAHGTPRSSREEADLRGLRPHPEGQKAPRDHRRKALRDHRAVGGASGYRHPPCSPPRKLR